jgi:hypothetical protein
MAIDGSKWQFLGRSPAVSARATRLKTNSLGGECIGGSVQGIWPGRGSFALSRWPQRHGHRRSIVQPSARTFPSVSIYNLRGFAEIVNAPTPICAPIPVPVVKAVPSQKSTQGLTLTKNQKQTLTPTKNKGGQPRRISTKLSFLARGVSLPPQRMGGWPDRDLGGNNPLNFPRELFSRIEWVLWRQNYPLCPRRPHKGRFS